MKNVRYLELFKSMNKTINSVVWQRVMILIEEWKKGMTFQFPDANNLHNVEEPLKLSHYYEIKARKTAEKMPQYECTMVCLNLYSYIAYVAKHMPGHETIHNEDALHMYALEAIRILQYDIRRDEEEAYSTDVMILLLRQIENMVLAREIAKRLEMGLILKPDEISYRDGIKLAKEDRDFINLCNENFSGKGKRLRMAKDTTRFFMGNSKNKAAFIKYLQSLLTGRTAKSNLGMVSGTYFEFLPGMDKNIE